MCFCFTSDENCHFLGKTVAFPNWLLIFFRKKTHSENKSWKSWRILRLKSIFFIPLDFYSFFIFSFFIMFHHFLHFSLFFNVLIFPFFFSFLHFCSFFPFVVLNFYRSFMFLHFLSFLYFLHFSHYPSQKRWLPSVRGVQKPPRRARRGAPTCSHPHG